MAEGNVVSRQVVALMLEGAGPSGHPIKLKGGSMIIHECSACGYKAYGHDEYEAENAFNQHPCPERERLEAMTNEELLEEIMTK